MILSNNNLQHIINKSNTGTKLSIYIPTHPASTSPTLSEDMIRFKNTLQNIKANEKYTERELGETMGKLESLLDDSDFWKHRTNGLAVLADKNGYEIVDLDYEITDMQYIQDTFIVSPLVMMFSIGTGYYVLDINHTKPRLLHFTSYTKGEVDLKDMPGSLEQTIQRDERQQHIQHQSAPRNMFHGQSESGAVDADILRYYKIIAKAVEEHLIDHDEPLLLAGTDNRIGHMRPLIGYSNIIDAVLNGNNEDLNEQELLDATTAAIESVGTLKRDKLITKVKATPLANLSQGITEIETAIASGRVEALYLSAFERTTDNVREDGRSAVVLQLPEDITAIESLVRSALLQGAEVVAVEQGSFDTDEPLALLRY
ncbi:MAG TPA: hypothetical protein VFD55_02505 [Candidatus Angelobacter sp.]|nr:hypothetical protein [Candidatus Angelobacter sp.]